MLRSSLVTCINRNILECKGKTLCHRLLQEIVLIETYWNVKFQRIDGLTQKLRINRNILECKELPIGNGAHGFSVLIETYWNVKIYAGSNPARVVWY